MKIICFGELLLRYGPDPEGNWAKNNQMPVYIGGAELNVAQALHGWGQEVAYCSALPQNYLSESIVAELSKRGIPTPNMVFKGKRIGAYYLPIGSELKNAGVIYDRSNSAFAQLQIGDFNWDNVFEGAKWFHISAICPALNQNIADLCLEALQAAKKAGLKVSIDLNYRKALWQYGENPVSIMSKLLPYCDYLMGNIWAIESLCGISNPLAQQNEYSDEELAIGAEKSCQLLMKQYPQLSSIALTFRMEKHYWALLYDGQNSHKSRAFNLASPKDRVGSGDCFMAGLIYGINQGHPANSIINFAASAAVGKLQEAGDSTQQSIEQINNRIHE